MVNSRLLNGKIVSAGYTQKTLAPKVEMSRSNLNAKINNLLPFNCDEVLRICDALNIVDTEEKVIIFLSKTSQ